MIETRYADGSKELSKALVPGHDDKEISRAIEKQRQRAREFYDKGGEVDIVVNKDALKGEGKKSSIAELSAARMAAQEPKKPTPKAGKKSVAKKSKSKK